MNSPTSEISKRTKRVVLIDDDRTDNFLHTRTLNRSGMVDEVVAFEHAEKAIDYLSSDDADVDIIFVDINMPRMNGFEFLDAFDALRSKRSVCPLIVMLSTSIRLEDEVWFRTMIPPVLTACKPLTNEKLTELIHRKDECNEPDQPNR